VYLHLGKVTRKRARRYGIDYEAWRGAVFEALDVDYRKLYRIGKFFEERLRFGKSMRIVSMDGTDLKFEIDRDSIMIDDGVIDENDLA